MADGPSPRTGYIFVQAMLDEFFAERLGPEAEKKPEEEFGPLRAIVRRALRRGTLVFSVQTQQDIYRVPYQVWHNEEDFNNISSLGGDLHRPFSCSIEGSIRCGLLIVDRGMASMFIEYADIWPPFEIPPGGKLLVRFWEVKQHLFSGQPCKKKDVIEWFRRNWPAELEEEWKQDTRLHKTYQKVPEFVDQLASVALTREERKGGRRSYGQNVEVAERRNRDVD